MYMYVVAEVEPESCVMIIDKTNTFVYGHDITKW